MAELVEHPIPQDVYDAHWHAAAGNQEFWGAELYILMESNHGTLARVCNVLCVLNLVPQSLSSEQLATEELSLTLKLGPVASGTVDLLHRKVSQLTDCLEVRLKVLSPVLGSHAVTP